jgi:hypothetical protein
VLAVEAGKFTTKFDGINIPLGPTIVDGLIVGVEGEGKVWFVIEVAPGVYPHPAAAVGLFPVSPQLQFVPSEL